MTTRVWFSHLSGSCIVIALSGICIGSAFGDSAVSGTLDRLPVYGDPNRFDPPDCDWLIEKPEKKTTAYRSADKRFFILDNGLVRRSWRVDPNLACVAFDNLSSGQSLLRATRPEACVVIDGKRWNVGGLTGQPNQAYLSEEWINNLKNAPAAFGLVGMHVGPAEERFAWKRVRHHAPDVKWPPEGLHVQFDFRLDDEALDKVASDRLVASDVGRALLLEDDFAKLDPAWRVHESKSHARGSFQNEGKPGEIYTLTNTSVFGERDLPEKTQIVELKLDCGTDAAQSWGPGLALVWASGKTIKLNARPETTWGTLGFFDGAKETALKGCDAALDLTKPVWLRLRIDGRFVHAEVSQDGKEWISATKTDFGGPVPPPKTVRAGKLDPSGGASDFNADKGELGRSKLLKLRAFGAANETMLAEVRKRAERWKQIVVSVHYELYDGIPAMSKWLTVRNESDQVVNLDRFTSEILAVVPHESPVEAREEHGIRVKPPETLLHVETDYAFCGFSAASSKWASVFWKPDPSFTTQVNYRLKTPCLLELHPQRGPDQPIPPGKTFESFRAYELLHDSYNRERKGLAVRKMYRTVAPWVTENPLILHVVSTNESVVRKAIDQAAECGFEMICLSFGSGLNMEDERKATRERIKRLSDYAKSKGLGLGGYSLLGSRKISPKGDNCINPATGKPGGGAFGYAPALASRWGQDYFRKLRGFFAETGCMLLEHDGSYPGDVDAAARPPLQKGLADSRFVQWRIITDFYKELRKDGVFLRVPDFYYLTGSSECGMGYRETNWSLPRAQQVIHTRLNIFDGTWEKTPSMGWMFVPLTQYHGGGAAATIEPLAEHLDHYRRMMLSNLATGVQACYRGHRLYDTEETKKMVQETVAWYKKYRDILESDLIHGRRADGRDVDWMLHANPNLKRKGMLVVFNPLKRTVRRTLHVNCYYTGLKKAVAVSHEGAAPTTVSIDHNNIAKIPVELEAEEFTWVLLQEP